MRVNILVCGLFFACSAHAADFTLTSTSMNEKTPIAANFTCDGQDQSPQLSWANPPAKTTRYALVMSDPDAPNGTWYHWAVFNIPSSVHELTVGMQTFPMGTMQGKNSWENAKYNGPCPPPGQTHHYVFTLYALGSPLNVSEDATAMDVEEASKNQMVGKATFISTYSRK